MAQTRVYHIELCLDDNVERPARLVRASNRAQAERHIMRSCLKTRVATQDDIIGLYEGGIEVAGEEIDDDDKETPSVQGQAA